jgi:hypothetical protein
MNRDDEDPTYRAQEHEAIGEVIAANAKAIFANYEAETMASLQRALYDCSDAGIAISFELHDGSFVWVGDRRARDIPDPESWVRRIGVSSIVEGSDVEVELQWLDLGDPKYADEGGEKLAVADFNTLCHAVNDEACRLWDEAHPHGKP